MSVRGALFALVLSGCYSPSFDTCSLSCATNDVCPSGFECSMGRCAVEGTNCNADAATDSMEVDTNNERCGDGTSTEGDICFEPPVEHDTGVSDIRDAQLVDGNGDGNPDIAFLNGSTYLFRLRSGDTFLDTNTPGPAAPGVNRMRGINLDANGTPELIHSISSTETIEIMKWMGTSWSVASDSASEGAEAREIAVGKIAQPVGERSIVMVFANNLRAYLLPTGNALQPLVQAGTGVTITGGRSVALGNFDNDVANVNEIAVADDAGVEVFRGNNNMLSRGPVTPITAPVDSVAACNVDGVAGDEIVYSIRAKASPVTAGKIGVVRWNPGNMRFEALAAREIPALFPALECADIDKDGRADAIAGAPDGNGKADIHVLRGRADGTFEPPIKVKIRLGLSNIRANADLDGDLIPEIVVTSSNDGVVTILESNP